jgi:predicted SAM-dependent methyltransferase
MKETLKKFELLRNFVQQIRQFFGYDSKRLSKMYHRRHDRSFVQAYLNRHSNKKLHIGCQGMLLDSWLNIDIEPKHQDVVMIDATQSFPFRDREFNYVFTEHMIEHISFSDAQFMLKECYRVMKNDGIIRISTPNLRFLIGMYSDTLSEVQKQYLQYSKKYLKEGVLLNSATLINNFFRDWGHQFIYDYDSMHYILNAAGFSEIKQVEVGYSEHAELTGLERHGREIGEEFNKLESMVIEARK